MPKLSILIPTYNYGRYLNEAIDSLIAQDFKDFEVIISDDASSDNTTEVVNAYVERDTRFHYVRQPKNLGMVANWNWCLQQASGDYVQYLFGDDFLISTQALSRLVSALDEHPAAGMAVSARRLANDCSKLGMRANDLKHGGIHSGSDVARRCLLANQNLVGEPSVVMFRRELGARGFDKAYKQLVDLEMWLHLCSQANLFFIAEPLCAFRQHDCQQTVANARDESTRLEMFHLFLAYKQQCVLHKSKFREMLATHTAIYTLIKDIRRSQNRAPAVQDVLAALNEMLPRKWKIMAAANYRIRKQTTSLRRSIMKRIK